MKVPVHVIKTPSEAKAHALLLSTAPVVAIDTETEPPDTGRARVIVWSACHDLNSRAVIHGDLLPHYAAYFANPDCKKVWWNYPYDYRVLTNRVQKLTVRGFEADAMSCAWLTDENKRVGLKHRVRDELHYHMIDFDDAFAFTPPGKKRPIVRSLTEVLQNDPQRLYEYASLDAWATLKLFLNYKAELTRIGLWDYYTDVERPFTKLLMEMEGRGILIDKAFVADVQTQVRLRRARVVRFLRDEAVRLSGNPKWELLSPRSPTQLKALLFDDLHWKVLKQTKGGKPSTDAAVLEEYASVYPYARLLREFRLADRMESGFVEPMRAAAELAEDGRLRTSFNQHGAVTGRISSRKSKVVIEETGESVKAGMQLQNIPARPEKDPYKIRKAFIAEPGNKLIVLDWSQIELRILAHMSQDATMLDAYTSKPEKDLHTITAVAVAKAQGLRGCVMPDWGDKASVKDFKVKWDGPRAIGKMSNFAIAYGAVAYTIAERLGIEESEAQAILDAFYETYPGVKRWQEETVEFAKSNGYVKTILGRHRRLDDISLSLRNVPLKEEWLDRRRKINHAERQAINTPIQGSAADLMKVAMLECERSKVLAKLRARMLLQVHDELIFEAPEANAPRVLEEAKRIMGGVCKDILTVPIPAEGGIADTWAEAKGG